MTAVPSVVNLSRGSTWKPWPSEAPYLTADPGNPWPAGAPARIVFYDTAGTQLATIAADSVTPSEIRFTGPVPVVDAIPNAANFEIFVQRPAGPDMIRYGKVIRKEVEFLDAPARQQAHVALNYTDAFPTLGLRSNWKPVVGRTKVYDNTNDSLPHGVSADAGLFVAKSAIRWDTPLNSDSVLSRVVLLNQGKGRCTVIVSADQQFTTGVAVDFNSDTNKLNLGIVTSPTEIAAQVPQVDHTVVDLAAYLLTYNNLTRTLAVYKEPNLAAPLLSWPDTLGIVAHGPGYRYAGFSFDTGALFQPGIEVASWQGKDN